MSEPLDEYHGVGGAYILDPTTNKRVPEDVFQERQKTAVAPSTTPSAPASSAPAKTTKE